MKYKRPSGTEIEVNDTPENRAYAAANNWVEVKPKRKRRTKAAMEAAKEAK